MIYDILGERPDLWQGKDIDKNGIPRVAHSYVWELFKMRDTMPQRVFWHDLYRLMDIAVFYRDIHKVRSAHTNSPESARIAREAGNKAKALKLLARYIVRYLKEYGGFSVDRLSVEQFYTDYENHLAFLPLSEWPDIMAESAQEDFKGVKLQGCKQTPFPKGFEDETAKAIYERLKEKGFIDCEESTFLYYFGNAEHRNAPQTERIQWEGQQNEFAYFCMLCSGKRQRINWQSYTQCFEHSFNADGLKGDKNAIENKKEYPSNAQTLEYCVKGEQ